MIVYDFMISKKTWRQVAPCKTKKQHTILLLDLLDCFIHVCIFLGGGAWLMGTKTANHSKISSIFSGGYEVSNTNHQNLWKWYIGMVPLAKGEDTFTKVTKELQSKLPSRNAPSSMWLPNYYHILATSTSRGLRKPRDIRGSKISSVAHSQIDYLLRLKTWRHL